MLICQKTPGCQKLDGHRSPCEVRQPRPYTPTTDEVRDAFAGHDFDQAIAGAQFDRWLAEVERAAAVKALTEAAEQFATQDGIEALMFAQDDVSAVEATEKWLIDRAAALGLTAGQGGESDGAL